MKRIAKLILLIFSAMLLTLTAFAVTSFAQDNSGVIATVTKIYPDSTVKTENITTSAKMEEALLGKSSYISVVTLKSDYNAGASSQGIDKNATVYLDLAGYKYYSITEAKAISLFTPCNSSTFYLYSSKAGGAVFNMNMNTDGGYTGHAIINYSTSYKNQTVYLGKVVDPITGVTHSGDNLSTYSSLLMDCSSKFNDNGRIYIDGGNYVRSSTGSAGLIILRDNTKVSIKNTLFLNTTTENI